MLMWLYKEQSCVKHGTDKYFCPTFKPLTMCTPTHTYNRNALPGCSLRCFLLGMVNTASNYPFAGSYG